MVTGGQKTSEHPLEPRNKEFGFVRLDRPERYDVGVMFVDTPGLDDVNNTCEEILIAIAGWLRATYALFSPRLTSVH